MAGAKLVATLKVAGNPNLDWVFSCHFRGDLTVGLAAEN
jgi:hypothetical protein